MPRGSKAKYTNKQERKAEHIEEGYKKRGVPKKEAERRAWATVNKIHKGGEKPGGGGYGKSEDRSPNRKGGHKGGQASASRPKAERQASARKAARTRARRGN
jgi:plasmid stabilization system protein ParE